MNIFAIFEQRIRGVLSELRDEGILPPDAKLDGFVVEPPRDAAHGDLATNAAMVLAKPARKNPKELASHIGERLSRASGVERVEIAGPGFINLTLKADLWPEVLRTILKQGDAYGRGELGAGAAANVGVGSANPTGPMHVGHTRGAGFGGALAHPPDFVGYKP